MQNLNENKGAKGRFNSKIEEQSDDQFINKGKNRNKEFIPSKKNKHDEEKWNNIRKEEI